MPISGINSIVEGSYAFVLKERDRLGYKNKGNVLVLCPQFEDHELGARMVSDFFTIAGYKVTFIGANTPDDKRIAEKADRIIEIKDGLINMDIIK